MVLPEVLGSASERKKYGRVHSFKTKPALIAATMMVSFLLGRMTSKQLDMTGDLERSNRLLKLNSRLSSELIKCQAQANTDGTSESPAQFLDPMKDSMTMQDVFTMAHDSEKKKYFYRDSLATMYLKGYGIEIGAKQMKQKLPKGAKSMNVDHMSTKDLLAKYDGSSERHKGWLKGIKKNPVERVDDAETLQTFEDDSLDFIVANHVLEHVSNFLGTLEVFAHKLRLGGIAFVALPDKRFVKEDEKRPITNPSLFLEELQDKSLSKDRLQSKKAEAIMYRKAQVGQSEFSEEEKKAAMNSALKDTVGGTHVNAFTTESLAMTLAEASMAGFPLRLVAMQQNNNENILILRKTDVTTSKDSTDAKHCYATSLGSGKAQNDSSCPKDVKKRLI